MEPPPSELSADEANQDRIEEFSCRRDGGHVPEERLQDFVEGTLPAAALLTAEFEETDLDLPGDFDLPPLAFPDALFDEAFVEPLAAFRLNRL